MVLNIEGAVTIHFQNKDGTPREPIILYNKRNIEQLAIDICLICNILDHREREKKKNAGNTRTC